MESIITTSECSWKNISINILGRRITGLRGFEVKETVEKEHLYGANGEPIDILEGNTKYEGNFKMLKYEVDLLNDAAKAAGYDSITKVPHALISAVVEFKKDALTPARYINVQGIGFTEKTFSMEQGGKFTEVTLPFLAIKIIETKAA